MDRKGRRGPSCVLCESQFAFKDPSRPYGARCPLLLQCGHSVCEGCMRSISRGSTSVKCKVCSTISEANKFKNPGELRESFPLNVYAIGQVSLKRLGQGKSGESIIGFYSQKKMAPNTVLCCECEISPADCTCRQCDVQFCNPCFTRIHNAGVTLKKHEKVLLSEVEKLAAHEIALCKEHPGQTYQNYCNVCSVYCCKDCVYKNHLEHECVKVIDKNKELLLECNDVFDEANAVLKQLYATRKKLQTSQPIDEEALNVEKQITLHYSQLHGILQLQEEELLKKVKSAQCQTHNSLINIADEVENNIKEMEALLTESNTLLEPSNLNNIPLHTLLEKLRNITAMPCHLILNDELQNSKYRFFVEHNIFEILQKHCSVTVPDKREYDLRPKHELPDNYVIESIPDFPDPFIKPDFVSYNYETTIENSIKPVMFRENTLPPTEIKTKGTSYQDVLRKNRLLLMNNNAGNTFSKVSSIESIFEKLCKIPPLTEGQTEVVRICHLVSPNNFYVQRVCCEKELEKLRDHFSRQVNIKRNQPDKIEPGQIYLVQYAADKKWYRAVVNKIQDNKCEVFYIDYGNSETVPVNKLREIPENCITVPGQAIHCGLYGCVPIENEWDSEAFKFMASMSNNVELSMYVENIHQSSGFHEVHLRHIDDVNGSFNDALIYLECAVRTESTNKEGGLYKQLYTPSQKVFFKNISLKKGDTFDAQITHINSPTNFYVQQIIDGGQLMLQLMKDLSLFYSSLGPQDHLIYNPVVGMPVAAKYKDQQWYRGIVRDIPRPRHVLVQYIDFGNIESVSWKDIRKLNPKFMRIGVQGLNCKLSDVVPKHEKGWSVSEKKAFENMAQKKLLLRVYVNDVEDSHLDVILYECQTTKDICINGLLVKQGHARSTGQNSAEAEYFRKLENRSDIDLDTYTYSPDVDKYTKLTTASSDSKWKFSLSSKQENMSSASSVKSMTLSDATSEPAMEASRIKIKVLRVVSPGELYITFENVFKQIMKLSNEMTKFYNSSEVEDRCWNVGDVCAVLRDEDKTWYRGLISEVSTINMESPEKYQVFIKDIADNVEVSNVGLRSLDPQFVNAVMDGSIKCHLCGMLPPGGSKKWALSTIDYLQALISEHSSLYMTQLGDLVDDSLPVRILMKNVKISPLDPVHEEWKDISQTLISGGFALPDRNSEHYTMMPIMQDSQSQDEISKWITSTFEAPQAQDPKAPDVEQAESISITSPSVPKKNIKRFNRPGRILAAVSNKISGWKPAEPFKKMDFTAIPSYVDYDGAIYLQDKEQSHRILEFIEKALMSLHGDSNAKPQDEIWSIGQICCGFYHSDSKWYRGKVTDVKNEYIEVLFVDYGNKEQLQPHELRKRVALEEIPIQCHRCLTAGLIPISPDGKWPIKTLDFIHGTIVTKDCRVQLKPPTIEGDEYVILNLEIPGVGSLFECLVSMHYATYLIDCNKLDMLNDEDENILDPDSSVMVPTAQNDIKKRHIEYQNLVLPDSLVELSVEILVVSSSTVVRGIIVDCDDPLVMSRVIEYVALHEIIQEEAEDMPYLTNPIIGEVCIGCYTEDDVWYRAIVLEINNDNMVKVQYVDYGNEEEITIKRLRKIKEDWTKTPVQCFHVTLFNICEGPAYDSKVSQQRIMSCLNKPPYTMTIEARQPCLEVDLYNSEGELAYQSLLNEGFFARIEMS